MYSLAHTSWECKYHIIFAAKFRRQVIYGKLKVEIGKILRAVGKNIKKIQKYINNHLKEDWTVDQISLDPFTGEKVKEKNKKHPRAAVEKLGYTVTIIYGKIFLLPPVLVY